ncbi:MAG: undecaprenyldiphospho-muramoylpentapeptide beta-N-acetylglucosaminyltransferase [Bacteroidetes bacterium]|nr:undecaprenyldiphospho-muramoylpentapeptide beta-N-acetylglucosaminyltransferase [Bacteroidota bacterium]
MKPLKVIISGGGTGGHIFPAVAIANQLKLVHSNVDILFVGAEGRMEMEKVPTAGYKIIGLWISGLQRKLTLDNLSFPFKVISSLWKARKIIADFKPDVVIGTGGYASGPMLRAASKKGIPTLIQEQNSYPGITNKILAKTVNKICVAYEDMERFFPKEKIKLTGNPIRQDITAIEDKKKEGIQFFNLQESKKTILVIGGSLGARTINESIARGLSVIEKEGFQLVWQTGKTFISKAKETIATNDSSNCHAFDFIGRMDLAYAVADVIISRAGASSISELCVVGKPIILVPSPNVAEDHQTKNAKTLVDKNAAVLVKDADASTVLVNRVVELCKNEQLQSELKGNIRKMALPQATKIIVEEVLQLVNAR